MRIATESRSEEIRRRAKKIPSPERTPHIITYYVHPYRVSIDVRRMSDAYTCNCDDYYFDKAKKEGVCKHVEMVQYRVRIEGNITW